MEYQNKSALLSGNYRFDLRRQWDNTLPVLPIVMLNPSTADALKDDPTIRRCVHFAGTHGFGGIRVYNLFPWRAVHPTAMFQAEKEGWELIPAMHDGFLIDQLLALKPEGVLCAWGRPGSHLERGATIKKLINDNGITTWRLGAPCDNGQPRHPLYLKSSTRMEVW